MDALIHYLRERASGGLVAWSVQALAAAEFGVSYADVEAAILAAGLLPARYQRNRKTFTVEDQLTFFRSVVSVVGCGGLGGYVVEELARLGVGRVTVVDPDVFEEHNLNRQLYSTVEALGRPKVDVAAERVSSVNPAVTVSPVREALTRASGVLISGSDVVVDALDSISVRLDLADLCDELRVPLVHGTIAGWYGQVATHLPGSRRIQSMYLHCGSKRGVERDLGNPSFTPAVVAGLQVAEVCKILLRKGRRLDRRILSVNLLDMEIEETEVT